ncbi:hypothetical protein R69749_04606 [Paraburkholderia domus]|nr:hypothetical protein R69749_04606 [Paraburkholderia domus]
MASSIGPADRRHATVRPVLLRVMRPASDSTSRCFITAGNDIANGSASSLTDRSFSSERRASNARRVGSDSAAKVRSSTVSLNLTMRLSIETRVGMSRTGTCFSQSAQEDAKGTLQKRYAAHCRKSPATRRVKVENNRLHVRAKRPIKPAPLSRYSKSCKTECSRIRSPSRRDRNRPAQ